MPMQTRRIRRPFRKGTARLHPQEVTPEKQKQVAAVADSCDECIAKLKFYHMNRTPKGKQEFVDLLVDVLAFTAKKHPEHTHKSLNALSYKGKIKLKDTSKDELARFARAAYADTQFMSRRKSKGMIAMSLIVAFFVSKNLIDVSGREFMGSAYVLPRIRKWTNARKSEDVAWAVYLNLLNALGVGATYVLSRSAFRQNASRLDAIIRKH